MFAPSIPRHGCIKAPRPPSPDSQPSTLNSQCCRAAFTLPRQRERGSAFTLFELLIVLGIIAIALVVLVPAVTSLSKAGGRRAARDTLLGGIEQARAEAIKS